MKNCQHAQCYANGAKHSITFFTKFRLSFLDRRHDHVSRSGGGQTVQPALDALDGDDEQVLGACTRRTKKSTSILQNGNT